MQKPACYAKPAFFMNFVVHSRIGLLVRIHLSHITNLMKQIFKTLK